MAFVPNGKIPDKRLCGLAWVTLIPGTTKLLGERCKITRQILKKTGGWSRNKCNFQMKGKTNLKFNNNNNIDVQHIIAPIKSIF
jgi:hypothetical protein